MEERTEDRNRIRERVNRRSFLKMLGAGAGSLALYGSAKGLVLGGKEQTRLSADDVLEVPWRTDDPEDSEPGDMWLRTDISGEV